MMKTRLIVFENLGCETNIYQKHEWFFANMVPISITKHKMTFGNLGIVVIWGSICWKARGGHQN